MKKIFFDELNVPVYLFSDEKDKDALDQVFSLARTHIPDQYIALMPDYHTGYGVPIGTVFSSERFVVPNAVGVDIGCGVLVIETDISLRDFYVRRKEISERVLHCVPTGFEWNENTIESNIYLNMPICPVLIKEKRNSKRQLGSLGGGNHFIEFQKDGNEDKLFIMIHSGSRNLGKQVADHYHNIAFSKLKKSNPNDVPGDLAFLDISSETGKDYLNSMNFCVLFARENRRLIGESILKILKKEFGIFEHKSFDVNHNFASMETIKEKRMLVHRKGALSAKKDEKIVIPGSMGSASYIAIGKGNELSYNSCSHGAGRLMSRVKAKKTFKAQEIVRNMQEKDIIVLTKHTKNIPEECEAAYKDIEKVISDQSELIIPIKKLTPIAVIKG